jgi:hypothetical protein
MFAVSEALGGEGGQWGDVEVSIFSFLDFGKGER